MMSFALSGRRQRSVSPINDERRSGWNASRRLSVSVRLCLEHVAVLKAEQIAVELLIGHWDTESGVDRVLLHHHRS